LSPPYYAYKITENKCGGGRTDDQTTSRNTEKAQNK
jgi:hypothetical protein